MRKNKYYFPVSISGDGYSTGYVLLTKDEAITVAMATNFSNWAKPELERWSGSFHIDINAGIPEEWFPEHERLIREWEDYLYNEAV